MAPSATAAQRTSNLISNIARGAARGAIGSGITQGVSTLVGLQDKFSWSGVAVGAVVGGVMSGVDTGLGMPTGREVSPSSAKGIGTSLASGMAGLVASAATRSLLEGTSFGDNIISALPDVIGSTIGNAVGAKLSSQLSERAERQARYASVRPVSTVSVDDAVEAPLQAWRPDDPGPLSTMPSFDITPYAATTGAVRRGQVEIGEVTFVPASRFSTNFTYKQTIGQYGSLTMQGPAGTDLKPTYGKVKAADGRDYSTLTVTDTNSGDIYYQGGYYEGLEVKGKLFSLSVSARDEPLTRSEVRSVAYADGLIERLNVTTDAIDHWASDPIGVTGDMIKATWEGGQAVSRLMNPLNFQGRADFAMAVAGQASQGVNQVQTAYRQGNLDLLVANRLGYYTPDLVAGALTGGEAAVARFGAAAPALRGAPLVLDEIGFAAKGAPAFAEIGTPYGPALQSMVPEAIAARSIVEDGASLYRLGTVGRSEAAEAQFWALEHPLNPGYAARYGIPAENVAKFDFIETATLKPGTPFVTRPAPGIGSNPGGGIEVVTPRSGVTLKYFGGH